MAGAAFEGQRVNLAQIPESVKRSICTDVAMRLGASHGRQSHYTPEQVATALRESRLPQNWDAWAMAVYCRRPAFDGFAATAGIDADYATIRSDIGRYAPAPKRPTLKHPGDTVNSLGDLAAAAMDMGEIAFDLVGSIFEGLDGV